MLTIKKEPVDRLCSQEYSCLAVGSNILADTYLQLEFQTLTEWERIFPNIREADLKLFLLVVGAILPIGVQVSCTTLDNRLDLTPTDMFILEMYPPKSLTRMIRSRSPKRELRMAKPQLVPKESGTEATPKHKSREATAQGVHSVPMPKHQTKIDQLRLKLLETRMVLLAQRKDRVAQLSPNRRCRSTKKLELRPRLLKAADPRTKANPRFVPTRRISSRNSDQIHFFQVQANEKGGLADAQSSGPGQTSSQAQIGFRPVGDTNAKDGSIFSGSGQASAQSTALSGQSQSQISGKFQ